MNKTIVYVGGNKGGTGKSLVAIALADYMKHKRGSSVLLIETDIDNPDVAKGMGSEVDAVVTADTRHEDGWRTILNTLESSPSSVTIINAGARDLDTLRLYGEYLRMGAEAIGADLIVLWVISHERDSLVALRDFLQFHTGTVWVVGNRFFEEAGTFALYHDSKLREDIERRGGGLVLFPILPRSLAFAIKSDRTSPASLIGKAPLFDRIVLERWRNLCTDAFVPILGNERRVEAPAPSPSPATGPTPGRKSE